MFLSESPQQLVNFSRQQNAVLLYHVKSEFAEAKRLSVGPHSWVQVLPPSTAALQRLYSTLYAARFLGGADPILPPLDTHAVHQLNCTYTCRGGIPQEPASEFWQRFECFELRPVLGALAGQNAAVHGQDVADPVLRRASVLVACT